MTEWDQLDNPELKKLFRKYILQGIVFMVLLAIFIFILAFIFEDQINNFAEWLNSHFGVFGLMGVVFVTDVFVSPIPPDATLFFIGRSELHQDWWYLVPLLGMVSTMAGVTGWWIGNKLKKIQYFRKMVAYFGRDYEGSAKKFGFWIVVIGALTPLPFSLTCWFAGIFKMPLKSFVIAASFRIPRFVIYYWAIFYSGEIGSLLRGLMNF